MTANPENSSPRADGPSSPEFLSLVKELSSEGKNSGAGRPESTIQKVSQDLANAVTDAELLLLHCVRDGIEIDPAHAAKVVAARNLATDPGELDIGALLAAISHVSAKAKPVTADTIRASTAKKTVSHYKIGAIILACFIIPLSIASFVNTRISDAVIADVQQNTNIGVGLRAKSASDVSATTSPPVFSDDLADLVQYASTMRAIHARTKQLNYIFLLSQVDDPFDYDANTNEQIQESTRKERFEVDPNFKNFTEFQKEMVEKIGTYQDVRHFANQVTEANSIIFGAINTYLLPILYAILGACASLLRDFSHQVKTCTFTESYANPARIIIAAIAGAVVALFSNFNLTQGPTLPPLAIAFLVGYAADVFFSFLDGLIRTFTKPSARPPAKPHQ
jgi:hypothetical protein